MGSVEGEFTAVSWFDDLKTPRIKQPEAQRTSKVPGGLWVKCPSCGEILQSKVFKRESQCLL
jgi:acetyl-CoA carboxylase beta subunit